MMGSQKEQPSNKDHDEADWRTICRRPAKRTAVFERTAERWLRLFENDEAYHEDKPCAEDFLLIDRAGELGDGLKSLRNTAALAPSAFMMEDLDLLGRTADGILDRIPLMAKKGDVGDMRFRVLKAIGWLDHAAGLEVEDVGDPNLKKHALAAVGRIWRMAVSANDILIAESLPSRWSGSLSHPIDVGWRLQREGVALNPAEALMLRDAALDAFQLGARARMSGLGRPISKQPGAFLDDDGNEEWWLGMMRRDDNRLLNEVVAQTVRAAKERRRASWDGVLDADIIAAGGLALGDIWPLLRPEQVSNHLRQNPGLSGVAGWTEAAHRFDLAAAGTSGAPVRAPPRDL